VEFVDVRLHPLEARFSPRRQPFEQFHASLQSFATEQSFPQPRSTSIPERGEVVTPESCRGPPVPNPRGSDYLSTSAPRLAVEFVGGFVLPFG
jgi:hypothetical protein